LLDADVCTSAYLLLLPLSRDVGVTPGGAGVHHGFGCVHLRPEKTLLLSNKRPDDQFSDIYYSLINYPGSGESSYIMESCVWELMLEMSMLTSVSDKVYEASLDPVNVPYQSTVLIVVGLVPSFL